MRFICLIVLCFFSVSVTTAFAKTRPSVLNIQHWTNAQGANVYFVAVPSLPIIDIQISFAAGSARDGKQAGIAQLTNSMLKQGTQHLSATQIAAQLDDVGALLNTDTERDSASIAFRSLTDPKALTPGLRVLSDILAHPQFPLLELNQQKQQTLNGIKLSEQSPSYRADQTFYETLYPNHPYAHPILGSTATVQTLTRQDVEQFYRTYYVASNAIIAIVGAIDRTSAERIANELTHDLPRGKAAPALPLATPLAQAKTKFISFPSHQTHLRLGQVGVRLQDPDYFPLRVGNQILGGDELISRLATEIREKNGLAYHVSSHFIPLSAAGPFIVTLQTQAQQAKKALSLTQAVLQHFIETGPKPEELITAQKEITSGFLLRLKNNAAITNNLAFMGFYHLPLDYLDTYCDNINTVTLQQIRNAFQRKISLQTLATIEVGEH